MRAFRDRFAWKLALVCIAASSSAAQQQTPASEVTTLLRQARTEISEFEKAGGKKDDPQHPVEKWVQTLWAIHVQNPRTPDGATAAGESVHLLIHADRFPEAYDRADRIAADDPAWQHLAGYLFEAGSLQKDFTSCVRKLESILPGVTDAKIQAAIQVNLGRAWAEQKEEAKAKVAFEAAVKSAPESPSGRDAQTRLYELMHLGIGQPAPLFAGVTLSGGKVSLADYRGKPVLIVFWAST